MRRLALTLIAVALTAPSMAQAGPFGFSMGEPISKYQVNKTPSPGIYQTTTAPAPHSNMDLYTISASPTFGVCKITASTRNNNNDPYGTELKSEFSELRALLIGKYGKTSEDFDFLKSGSIWTEPREFTTGLDKNERFLVSFWKISTPEKFDNILTIMLESNALDSDTNYISIIYEFSNFSQCRNELDAKDNSTL